MSYAWPRSSCATAGRAGRMPRNPIMRRSGPSVLPVPIYVTHQSLERHAGGASAVTAWVLQALCLDFNVLLATPDPVVDFKRIDHRSEERRVGKECRSR